MGDLAWHAYEQPERRTWQTVTVGKLWTFVCHVNVQDDDLPPAKGTNIGSVAKDDTWPAGQTGIGVRVVNHRWQPGGNTGPPVVLYVYAVEPVPFS